MGPLGPFLWSKSAPAFSTLPPSMAVVQDVLYAAVDKDVVSGGFSDWANYVEATCSNTRESWYSRGANAVCGAKIP